MVLNDKRLISIYNICIHDIANFFFFFQYFQVTQFVCKFCLFQIVTNLQNTFQYIYLKIFPYKWVHTVQTCIVQGSPIIHKVQGGT